MKELFTENSRMIFRDVEGNVLYDFDSPELLVRSAEEAVVNAVTLHHLHNPEIILRNESEAEGIWAMEDRFYLSADAALPFFHGAGYYHVQFILLSNRWYIRRLELLRLRLRVAESFPG